MSTNTVSPKQNVIPELKVNKPIAKQTVKPELKPLKPDTFEFKGSVIRGQEPEQPASVWRIFSMLDKFIEETKTSPLSDK